LPDLGLRLPAQRITARVPDDRDRVADLLRVAAIAFVVVGHWMVAVVLERDGEIVDGQLLAIVPETQVLTWVFQVMPLFFFIGGSVNAGSWQRAAARGAGWSDWVRERGARLLRPLIPVLVLWTGAVLVADAVGVDEELVETAAETALLPIWFLVVYLIAIGITPLTLALDRRFGLWVIVAAPLVVVVVDVLHRAEVPAVGFLNYLVVWGSVHQLGYLWADGRLPVAPRRHLLAGLVGASALVPLVVTQVYPVSMVAVWGAERQNSDPPSLALWLFAVTQIALVTAAREPLRRWMQRDRPYALVVVAGGILLTVFLWHMTAFVVVAAIAGLVDAWPMTARVDGTWWALRPLWLGVCTLVLAGFVALFGRVERSSAEVGRAGVARTAVGLVALVASLAVVMTQGLYDPERPFGVPPVALGGLVLGFVALAVVRPFGRRPRSPGHGASGS
jgi:hypothetical protein